VSSRNCTYVLHPARAALFLVLLCGAAIARAQGPAPETAPPLFPGGGLVSYNSIFATRGATPLALAVQPASIHSSSIDHPEGGVALRFHDPPPFFDSSAPLQLRI